MRVLYVEDNETNQALVGRVSRARQHSVLFREDGEAALEVLEQDPAIDLVLLDIELAGTMSGIDVIKVLRERGDKRPVVAVTAYAMMGDRERIMEAGCDQYLPKPLVIPDLLALLDHYAHRDPAAPKSTGETAAVQAAPEAAASEPAASDQPSPADAAPNGAAPDQPAAAQAAAGDQPGATTAQAASSDTPGAAAPSNGAKPEAGNTPASDVPCEPVAHRTGASSV